MQMPFPARHLADWLSLRQAHAHSTYILAAGVEFPLLRPTRSISAALPVPGKLSVAENA